MQSSSDKGQPKQDERTNGVEDPMVTIEYLRARLLSERSISKATKDRADEFARRVNELEEQLKVITLQRKRAEHATLDVLSYLNSLGVGDVAEVYESDSNEEDSQCESNMHNGETTEDNKKFGPLEVKRNDESGSESESTPSDRSLSWKGCKDSTRLLENNRLHSPIQRRTTLAQVSSSPRHRLGRSCRKIKRREPRSTTEEARHESGISEAQDGNAVSSLDCLGSRDEELKNFSERCSERGSEKEEVSHSFQAAKSDASSYTHELESSGEMERALKHQAQLIRSYEAQEKAQRDWEEKYGDNNDSCEPGNHSDVTEERDENKATVSQLGEIDPCHNHDQKTGIITHFNSFKLSYDADTVSSEKYNVCREMQPPISPTPDFAFSVANNSNQSSNDAARHPLKHASLVDPSQNVNGPCKQSAGLGVVLDALQEAKLLIKQQMNSSPETSNRDVDGLRLPVGCQGLFRVPTDFVDSAPGQTKSFNLDYSSGITNSTDYGKTLAVQDHHRYNNSSSRSDPYFSTPDISNRQPSYDFHFDTNLSASIKSNLTSHSSYPGFFPGLSSNQMIGRQFLGIETGIQPSGYSSFQNHDVRTNMYGLLE